MRAVPARTQAANITYANLASQGRNPQLVGIIIASLAQVRDGRLYPADDPALWL